MKQIVKLKRDFERVQGRVRTLKLDAERLEKQIKATAGKGIANSNSSAQHAEPREQGVADYQQVLEDIEEANSLLKDGDPDMREMAEEELQEAEQKQAEMELQLQTLLLPKDPNDSNNVFLEIRAGTGGDEAAIFAGDLFRMYSRYCENLKWARSSDTKYLFNN